jgi:hypothetical protein
MVLTMLILKIAAGVMLGILAAALVVSSPLLAVAGLYYVGVVFAVLWLVSLPLRPWIKPLR